GEHRDIPAADERERPPARKRTPRPDHRQLRTLCVRPVALYRGTTVQNFGVRERNLWDVAFPEADDPVYKQMPTHFRAEMHDRLAAPLYPIAFTVLCFAILCAPRTSRQSRELSIIMTVALIGPLRLVGFACNVVAAQSIVAIYVLWGSMALAFGA